LLCIGEGPEKYWPFRDLRSVPEVSRPKEQVSNHGRACTQVLIPRKAELGFFDFFGNSDRLAGTFRWSEDPSTTWLVPSTAERSHLLKTSFFRQASKGDENTKEKSRQCFTHVRSWSQGVTRSNAHSPFAG
jgi:hypothetical protein